MAKALPDADLAVFVNDLIHLLELDHVADWLVGSETSGIPRGERKRYTIGVELVTNPSVLFLGKHAWLVLNSVMDACGHSLSLCTQYPSTAGPTGSYLPTPQLRPLRSG